MGLVLGIITALATLAGVVLVLGADAMSDNPNVSISPWPVAIGGGLVSAVLIYSHYHHISW